VPTTRVSDTHSVAMYRHVPIVTSGHFAAIRQRRTTSPSRPAAACRPRSRRRAAAASTSHGSSKALGTTRGTKSLRDPAFDVLLAGDLPTALGHGSRQAIEGLLVPAHLHVATKSHEERTRLGIELTAKNRTPRRNRHDSHDATQRSRSVDLLDRDRHLPDGQFTDRDRYRVVEETRPARVTANESRLQWVIWVERAGGPRCLGVVRQEVVEDVLGNGRQRPFDVSLGEVIVNVDHYRSRDARPAPGRYLGVAVCIEDHGYWVGSRREGQVRFDAPGDLRLGFDSAHRMMMPRSDLRDRHVCAQCLSGQSGSPSVALSRRVLKNAMPMTNAMTIAATTAAAPPLPLSLFSALA
jgi:hypothetical protein